MNSLFINRNDYNLQFRKCYFTFSSLLKEELPRNAVKPLIIPDGQLRMITQGQELLIDYDEKTLAEMGFKDMQVLLITKLFVKIIYKKEIIKYY